MHFLHGIVTFFFVLSVAEAGQIGTKAPRFSLRDLKGGSVSSESFSGHVVLVIFWATWCGVCKEELAELEALSQQYRDKGLMIIAINVDAAAPKIADVMNRIHTTYPLLVDDRDHTADAYRVTGLPTSFLIGRDGVIRYRHAGFDKALRTLFEAELIELLKQ